MSRESSPVFVIDDDRSVRDSLRNLLRSVGLTAETFASAEEFLSSHKPLAGGCLILDVRMPGLSGLDLQRRLAESHRQMPIVFITGHGDIPMSVRAVKGGAVEFLTKPFRDQDLLDAVQQAVKLDEEMRRRSGEIAEFRRRYEALTHREREVLGFVVLGYANKQIAAELNIGESTVKVHRGRMMHKMQADSVAGLVNMAQTAGAIDKQPYRAGK